jgi:hypothetical protein
VIELKGVRDSDLARDQDLWLGAGLMVEGLGFGIKDSGFLDS